MLTATSLLPPFGAVVTAGDRGHRLGDIEGELLARAIAEHRVVVLRGFDAPSGDDLPLFAARLGELQAWDFGVVNELHRHEAPANYLYTSHAVPFHWDGAFAARVPRFISFHCVAAPTAGGETLFCDTVRLLERAPREKVAQWERIRITYTTERVAHYGGSFTSPVIARHPCSGRPVLRFAEPVFDLNPVSLDILGIDATEHASFLDDMRRRLAAPEVCYRHAWREGDLLLADNHALLHGRAAYDPSAPRHIRRVNVL